MSDLIGELLADLRLYTRIFRRGQHCGRWRLEMPQGHHAVFHLVLHGDCIIEPPDGTRIELNAGDVVLLAHGCQHGLRSPVNRSVGDEPLEVLGLEAPLQPDSIGLICGYFYFDPLQRNQNLLIDALPDCVVARANGNPRWVEKLIALLFAESMSQAPARETIIERLADVLFVHILRSYLKDSPQPAGIYAAIADPALRAALDMMHREPQRPWATLDFALAAGLSRTTFVDRFKRLVGIPPIAYLTSRRLSLAYRLLTEGRQRVLDIALTCGYESEAAFSKAFKRYYGIAPSTLKRRSDVHGAE